MPKHSQSIRAISSTECVQSASASHYDERNDARGDSRALPATSRLLRTRIGRWSWKTASCGSPSPATIAASAGSTIICCRACHIGSVCMQSTIVRRLRSDELVDDATELPRSVPVEAEEPPKATPALAPSRLAFGYFLDRIQLRRDTS